MQGKCKAKIEIAKLTAYMKIIDARHRKFGATEDTMAKEKTYQRRIYELRKSQS